MEDAKKVELSGRDTLCSTEIASTFAGVEVERRERLENYAGDEHPF